MRGLPLRAFALLVASLTACRSAGGSSTAVELLDDAGTHVPLATGVGRAADSVATAFEAALARESAISARGRADGIPVLLLAWDQPAIALGGGLAGGRNVFAEVATPSAPVSLEAIAAREPAVVILVGSEMPGLEHRPEWRVLPAVREGRVVRLTESSSNRPSPRAPQAVRSLRARLASFTALTPSGDSR